MLGFLTYDSFYLEALYPGTVMLNYAFELTMLQFHY